jgi:hypothetical protein
MRHFTGRNVPLEFVFFICDFKGAAHLSFNLLIPRFIFVAHRLGLAIEILGSLLLYIEGVYNWFPLHLLCSQKLSFLLFVIELLTFLGVF